MTTDLLPEIVYRKFNEAGGLVRGTMVSSLQYDGTAAVAVESDRCAWSDRAAALLKELRNAGEASETARGHALPYASLRAAIAATVPDALLIERDLGMPWADEPRAFLAAPRSNDLEKRLGHALSLWVPLSLRPWAEKVGASESLVDALQQMGEGAFAIQRRETSYPEAFADGSGFGDFRDAIIQTFSQALKGRELFEGMGPVWRIVRSDGRSNAVEFVTWPSKFDDALYSMVATITVELMPFSKQPIVNVRASRRRWLSQIPAGRSLFGQKRVTVTVLGRDGANLGIEVAAPVASNVVEDPVAPEFLAQLFNVGGDVGAPIADLVAAGAGSATFVGVAYSPKLGGSHKVGAGVTTRDQTDLFDAVQDAVDEFGFVPLAFEETPTTQKAPKRSEELHKALEVGALLSDVAVSLGRNDLMDDASIEAAWSSLSLSEEAPPIDAITASTAGAKLVEVRAANVERVRRAFGDAKPHVVVIARSDEERKLVQTVLTSLFGASLQLSARPLPTDVHGYRHALPKSEGKSRQRFEARVEAWRPLAELMLRTEGSSHALVQAAEWYDGKPDDPVNKLAGRYSLASEANANVQYLRPRASGPRGLANYFHRVQAAIYDLIFGHAGLVSEIDSVVSGAFPDAASRPTCVVGISVLAQARTRVAPSADKLCIATRIDCASGRTTARVGWHDGEMRWSAEWEPLFQALKRVASPEVKPSLGDGIANQRASFQAFVREILDSSAEAGDRPLVIVDSNGAAPLWSWLKDDQIGADITLGTERIDVSRRWPGARVVRVRTGHASRLAQRKTVQYRKVELASGQDVGGFERYCPTVVARTIKLSDEGANSGHYWSTAGYFQMTLPRGLSVYRRLESLVPIAKAFKGSVIPAAAKGLLVRAEIPIYEVSYRLPNPIEITVAKIAEGDEPDKIAHLVSSLRYGYGHTASSTTLPAPLSFESKVRDYMTRFALDVGEEADELAAEVGSPALDEDDADVDVSPAPPGTADQPDASDNQPSWQDVTVVEDPSGPGPDQLSDDPHEPAIERTAAMLAQTIGSRPAGHTTLPVEAAVDMAGGTWSELSAVIRMPAFVDLTWIEKNVHVANSQLRGIHQARNEIADLSGFESWPCEKPDLSTFQRIVLAGLGFPRFLATITQIAKRSVAPTKRSTWTPFKPLLNTAYAVAHAIVHDRGLSTSAISSTKKMVELLVSAGEIELALSHIVRRAFVEPLEADTLALIRADDLYKPLREFAEDVVVHLFRDDYSWHGDLRRLPARPVEEKEHRPSGEEIAVEEKTASTPAEVGDIGRDEEVDLSAEVSPSEVGSPSSADDCAVMAAPSPPPAKPDPDWIASMAAISLVATDAVGPDQTVLDQLEALMSEAALALAIHEASRPRGVDATQSLDRALETFTYSLAVLIDAAHPAESLPVVPMGPYVTIIDTDAALALQMSLEASEATARDARAKIDEARRIMSEMQIARFQEGAELTAEAVAMARDVTDRLIIILQDLKSETAGDVDDDLDEEAPASGSQPLTDILAVEADDPFETSDETWNISQDPFEDDAPEPVVGEPMSRNVVDTVALDDAAALEDLPARPDPMETLLLARFEEFIGGGHFSLAYHLSTAATNAGVFDRFPMTRSELKLAAVSRHVNHAAFQGSDTIQETLRQVNLTFATLEDDAPNALARRIVALAALAPFALYHNDPEATLALEELRQVGHGLGQAVHAFREALAAPLRSGLNFSPSLMRLTNQEAKDDEYARELSARLLRDIEEFSHKTYKFQLGNKLRNALTKSDGELGRLRDRVEKSAASALEAARHFAQSYGDRSSIIHLLEQAEIRVSSYKLTGIDGIARERMVGLIQGIAALCAEFVEAADAAPAMRGTLGNIQRAREAIESATGALDQALSALQPSSAFEDAAIVYARRSLRSFLSTVRGVETFPSPTDYYIALHGALLWVPGLDFGKGWMPAPYVPDMVLGSLLGVTQTQIAGPTDNESFAESVRARVSSGSHIAASIMIAAADFFGVPAALADALDEERQGDAEARRDALGTQLREARLAVDRVQRMVGVGSQDEAQSLLSLLNRIDPSDLPTLVPLEARTEKPESEQILDFKAAYGLVADVRTKVETLLKRPRDELVASISAMAKLGTVAQADLDEVLGMVARDDLLTATEYLGFLKDGRALPKTASPNPRFRSFFPNVPELLSAMSRTEQDGALAALEGASEFAGVDFGRIDNDHRQDAVEALTAWNELRRAVGGARPETEVASRLALMLERFGFKVEINAPNARNNRRLYSADLHIQLQQDEESVLLPDFGSQTDGNYRVCIGTKIPSETEIRAIQADAGALRIVYFVTETVTPERRKQLQLSCLQHQTRLLVIDESMVLFAAGERELRGLTMIELAQPFSFADPYHDYGNMAVPREMFFGRTVERRKLLEPHGSCIVYGGRRLGKTALLRHIQAETDNAATGAAVAYVTIRDLGGNAGENQIWEYMSRELKSVFPRPVETSERFSETIRQWLVADNKRRVLVLLDESDRFIQADASKEFAQFIRLQKLMDDTSRRFKFVLAGLHNVTRLVHTENPPLKQIASDPQRIGPLMDEELKDAELLVTRPLAGMGYEFEKREDVWRILSYCNYYPVLVQKFCKELLRQLIEETTKRRKPVTVITSDHIRRALEDGEIAKEIGETFDYTISKIEDRYSLIANIVADRALRDAASGRIGEGMSAVEVRDAAALWWPAAFGEANRLAVVEDLLDEMEGLGVLRLVPPNRWALRSLTILRLLGDDDKIAAKLGEFMERDAPAVFDPRSMRRRLKANTQMRIPERAMSPLTLGQEHDLLRDRAPVTLVFGNALSDIGQVAGALISAGSGSVERNIIEVYARSYQTLEALTKDLKSAPIGEPAILNVVSNQTQWDAAWVDQALRVRSVREGRSRVVFVGGASHAASWVFGGRRDALTSEVKVVPLQTWSATLIEELLQQEHLDPAHFRASLREATGGFNSLMYQLLGSGSNITAKSLTTRIQTALNRRRRDLAVVTELGLEGDMLSIFRGIVEFTSGEITAYEIKEGPIADLNLDYSSQGVVDFGVLLGLLEPQSSAPTDAEDVRPFRLNPLLTTLLGNRVLQ